MCNGLVPFDESQMCRSVRDVALAEHYDVAVHAYIISSSSCFAIEFLFNLGAFGSETIFAKKTGEFDDRTRRAHPIRDHQYGFRL